ncbi:MAG TPA: aspartyl protease family protein [Aliidongia sp.]|nr:aspartyl protease family protein [Aliidongia sp.]
MHLLRPLAMSCLALLAALGSARAQNCQLQQVASFPAYNDPSGTVQVPVRIDDKLDTSLLLDTGAFMSLLGEHVVSELNLRETTTRVVSTDLRNNVSNRLVTPKLVQLGKLRASSPEFLVYNNTASDYEFGGLFGADFLSNYDLDIDFGQMKVSLFSQGHCDGKVVYWSDTYNVEPMTVTWDKHIFVDVKVNGNFIRAMIDTGSINSVLSKRAAAWLLGARRDADGNAPRGDEEARIETLEFAGITFRNTPIGIMSGNMPDGIGMILGMRQLRRLHLYIAYGERKLYATPLDQRDIDRQRENEQRVADCSTRDKDGIAPELLLARLFKSCEALLASTNELPQTRVWAFINRGYAHEHKGEYELALADEDQAIKLDPRSWSAYWTRGSTQIMKGAYADAVRDLGQAIAINPKYARLYIARGLSDAKLGDWQQAVVDYTRGVELAPRNADSVRRRGFALHMIGADDRAIADLDRAILLDPKMASAWNERCLVKAVGGALDKAADDCAEALRLEPQDAAAIDTRAFVRLQSGQLDLAIADYDAALARRPDNPASLYGRSRAKERKGDKDAAAADLAAALKLKPDIAERFARDP